MIELFNLHKQYGASRVLQGASLTVRPGEVSVLVGPSGGGKSTLLRAINGLERMDRGTIRVGDLQWEGPHVSRPMLAAVRRRVGMVFQQFHLFPHLTVLENVIEAPQRVLGLTREAAEHTARELLARVGLQDKLQNRPRTLSGGQQQRVAIVRTLAMQPQVILFDEPTSALDPRMTAEVTAVIGDLAQAGQTMVIVTHAMNFARRVADTVHVMHGGRIAESGTPLEIFDHPKEEVTRILLAETAQQTIG